MTLLEKQLLFKDLLCVISRSLDYFTKRGHTNFLWPCLCVMCMETDVSAYTFCCQGMEHQEGQKGENFNVSFIRKVLY